VLRSDDPKAVSAALEVMNSIEKGMCMLGINLGITMFMTGIDSLYYTCCVSRVLAAWKVLRSDDPKAVSAALEVMNSKN